MITKTLDARGLNCPLPILKAKQALGQLEPGQVLEVLCSDPGSLEDFGAFCRTTGNALLSHERDGDLFRYQIERRG